MYHSVEYRVVGFLWRYLRSWGNWGLKARRREGGLLSSPLDARPRPAGGPQRVRHSVRTDEVIMQVTTTD